MALTFHELPESVFPDEAQPYIKRLNRELRDLFALEGSLSSARTTSRSDASIKRRDAVEVHVTRITPRITDVVSGASTIIGIPALTFSTSNAVGTTRTVVSVNSTVRLFDASTPAISDAGVGVAGTSALPSRNDHKHQVLTASPAFGLSTGASLGAASSLVRSDATVALFDATVPAALAAAAAHGSAGFAADAGHVHAFPVSLESVTSSTTLSLTDNATDQTLTGSLGTLNLRPTSEILSLPKWTGGAAIAGAVGQVLSFNARSSVIGTSLVQGVNAQITFDDASTYTSQTHVAGRFVTRTSSQATYSSETAIGTQVVLNQEAAPAAASTFTARTGLDMSVNPVLGASTTTTDHYGIKIAMQGAIGTHGANTNSRGILVDVPAFGTTIRRGVHVQTTTANRGTASANTEGVYCDAITIGTAQRANFYAAGAGTGTPTDVYGLFQGTGHGVGTNRYGARFSGTTSGTPTLAVGVYCDAHGVGTTKWSFYANDPSYLAGIVVGDATNVVTGLTTGTIIGTSTAQKLGFWNAGPVVQPATTGISTSGFTANVSGNTVYAESTFTGNTGSTAYDISSVVRCLKNCGILAA